LSKAPIVLFVYNRPRHTQQTIEALQKNELATHSNLFVYSDAPKTEQDQEKVQEVRTYIRLISGFKKITIIERELNWGLADSIIDGVTSIINRYGKIIVLEDDIVTSPYYLHYMNDALDFYQNEEKVMHISGWNYPINTEGLDETFFLRTSSCWGWSTWKRAWKFFDKDPQNLVDTFTKKNRSDFDFNVKAGMWSQVTENLSGKLNTWAIFWYATVFKVNGLCLHPSNSLVKNIGHDGSGVHCEASDTYHVTFSDKSVAHFSDDITENSKAMGRIQKLFLSNRKSFFDKVINRLFRMFGNSR
jgi:GT2 family glycosyltransferase